MSDEKIFVDGMIVRRHENAPDFVLCNLAINMKELIAFAKQHHKDGWVNIQCKTSKGGKHYAELDTFQPSEKAKHDAGMEQARAAVEDPGFSDLEEPPF